MKVKSNIWFRFLVVVLIVTVAAALRLWPLQSLGLRTVWVTFYPAVMLASLYGGLYAGLLGAVLSCFIVLFLWPIFVDTPFIKDSGDWIGLAVFLFTCTGISIVSELMKKSQKKAKLAKEQAEAANRAKSVFLANMSHELRTPLNSILGFTRLIRNSNNIPKEQVVNLDIIIQSGEHLLNLINNILDISKIESEHVALEEKETDLYQIIAEMKSLTYAKTTEKRLTFKVEQAPDVPQFIYTDQTKLRQVLINILNNALKYTNSGGIILRVAVVNNESIENIQLRFEVEDTGIGIPTEDRERIFQSFVQLANQPLHEAGTGLGLAICKQGVEVMHGKIGVSSEVGKGSVFFFEIPVKKLNRKPAKTSSCYARIKGVAEGQPRFRILIVEDHPLGRKLIHKIIEPLGFDIDEAENGKIATELFEINSYDLIWMDIRMPVMDGVQATRYIRTTKKGEKTPIIALTAHALENERIEILEAGCDDLLRKPYRDSEIYDMLSKYLGVEYEYIDETLLTEKSNVTLNSNRFASIPTGLVKELQLSLELLDSNLCLLIIDQINKIDPSLARSLEQMVNNLQYGELIEIIDVILKGNKNGQRN